MQLKPKDNSKMSPAIDQLLLTDYSWNIQIDFKRTNRAHYDINVNLSTSTTYTNVTFVSQMTSREHDFGMW